MASKLYTQLPSNLEHRIILEPRDTKEKIFLLEPQCHPSDLQSLNFNRLVKTYKVVLLTFLISC